MKTIHIRVILIFVFIGSVFIDMYTGYSKFLGEGTTLQFFVKGFVILYSLPYLLRGNKVSNAMLIGLLLLLISAFYWVTCGYTDLNKETVTIMARFVYPYCLFLIFYSHRSKFDSDDILHFAMYYGVIAACSILLLDVFNLGFSTLTAANNAYGYGVKGFFVAGNDTALALLLCSCITCYYASSSNKKRYMVYNILLVIACFRLGMRAAAFGSILLQVLFVIQSLLVNRNLSNSYYKYRIFILFCAIPLAIYGVYAIMQTDSYMMRKYDVAAMLEGRNVRGGLINAFDRVYAVFSTTDYLFGIGTEELNARIGLTIYNVNRFRSIEVDHLEIMASYGYVLGLLIIAFPIIYFCRYALSFLKKRQAGTYWLSIALAIYIAHGFIAGHAYTSVQASTIMIGLLFYQDRTNLE